MMQNENEKQKNVKLQRQALSLCLTDFKKDNFETMDNYLNNGMTRDYFTDDRMEIFDALCYLKNNCVPIMISTLEQKLSPMPYVELSNILDENNRVYSLNPQYFFDLLKEQWWKQTFGLEALKLSDAIIQAKPIEETKQQLMAITELANNSLADKKILEFRATEELTDNLVKEIDDRIKNNKNGNPIRGYWTGFKKLDQYLKGFCKGRMYVLAARTSVGKTTIAINFANTVLKQNKKVSFFSCEMTDTEIIEKLLSLNSGVDYDNIFNGTIVDKDKDQIYDQLKFITKVNPNIFHRFGRSISKIESIARELKNKNEIDFLVVDYIQQLTNNVERISKQAELTDISARLKQLALDLEIPALVLAQLNRDAADNTTPQLHHIRDCGSIEQDADAAMFLIREVLPEKISYYLDIAKNRHGDLCKFEIWGKLSKNRFMDVL